MSSRVCVDHMIELHDGFTCAMVKFGISLSDGNQQKLITIILIATNSILELINYQQCYPKNS
jgi:hypothetical protein